MELVHDPDNKFDALAVEVHWDGHCLGFLPAKGKARAAFFESQKSGLDIKATITGYAYAEYVNGKIQSGTFNDQHEGMLGSITLNLESAVSETHYSIEGEKYMRTTTVSSSQNVLGFLMPEHLYNWMMKFGSWVRYVAGIKEATDDGTKKHEAIELFFRDDVKADLPHGIEELKSLYSVDYLSSEKLVVDHGLMVAGSYDMLATVLDDSERKTIIFDWKRGKVLKWGYLLQSAFYCVNTDADGFWIVLLGTKNKCGYSIKKYTRVQANKLYVIFALLAKVLPLSREWKEFGA